MAAILELLRAALADRYRVEREIGSGGMATVYLAEDLKHRRAVAIKALRPELGALLGPARFLREIEIAARLHHPHILAVFDSGAAGDLLYYVMPYVEGESLRARLVRERQLPLEDALGIAREVADALEYAHGRDVVHRDVKPENILLESGHAVVADFGIARAVTAECGGTLTATGMSLGTPAYMSPEQASGVKDVDGRSDVYALGCVLYEMLAGQPPFTGATAESLVHQHFSVAPRPVTELRPAVPGWVAAAVQRALAKAPADRFGRAALFAEALSPREATDPSTTLPRPVRRAGRWAAIAAAVVVVVVAGALLAGRVVRRSAAPAAPVAAHGHREVAVLPFQNLSPAGPHAYFAGGLQDELLTQLAQVAALKVISRTSVMGYAGTTKPVRQIAEELGVGALVEGTVQVEGDRLRVNVQLIDAATDEHLWAQRYDRRLDDAFAIQSEVAQRIVAAVGAALTSDEEGRIAAPPTANAEAYRLYLQGREYWNRPGYLRQDIESARRLYEGAVALDPGFALAHSALSKVYGRLQWYRYDTSPAVVARQREEAETAVRLAPDLPQAHAALGVAYYWGHRDYRRALEELAIAARGLRNDAEIWGWVGYVHRRMGDWDQVFGAFETVSRLDPRNANVFLNLGGNTYQITHRYAEAVHAYDRALALAPDLELAAVYRGWTFASWQGRLDSLRQALGRLPGDGTLGELGSVAAQRAALLLWERDAEGLLREVRSAGADVYVGQTFFLPKDLYAGWASRMRGDRTAMREAFVSALQHADSAMRLLPDDWRIHVARGLALAGLGRRVEALQEAGWLQRSEVYRRDALDGPSVAEDRALILAQAGESEPALDEVERLLAGPSWVTVHTLRLDPRWDPIRGQPRFKTLVAKYATRVSRRVPTSPRPS